MSCPSIAQKPYIAITLSEQLESATMNFLSNSSKNKISNKTIYLSKIFKWYKEDFNKYNGVILFIQEYIPNVDSNYKIKYLDYDWKINHIKN